MNNNNILDLPPINANFGYGWNSTDLHTESAALTKSEIRETNQDSVRRRLAIDILGTNNEQAARRVILMEQNTFVNLFQGTQFIFEMNMEAHGTPYQKYCDAITDRMIKTMSHHTFALLEAGAARIAYEVNRPPQLEMQKGFLDKLLGGG